MRRTTMLWEVFVSRFQEAFGLQIDDQFELRRPHDGLVGRLPALENPPDRDVFLPIRGVEIRNPPAGRKAW